jgi:hypothetical protein
MKKYKWSGPHEWLRDKGTSEDYRHLVETCVEPDAIQHHLQSGMEADGYFRAITRCECWDGHEVHEDQLSVCYRCGRKVCDGCYSPDDNLPCGECEYEMDAKQDPEIYGFGAK